MQTLVSRNLKYLLDREGMNAYELAGKTNVPQPTIHRILSGESRDPRTQTVKPIADYFGVSVSDMKEKELANSDWIRPTEQRRIRLTEREESMIIKFRSLLDEQQAEIEEEITSKARNNTMIWEKLKNKLHH